MTVYRQRNDADEGTTSRIPGRPGPPARRGMPERVPWCGPGCRLLEHWM